MPFRLIAAEDDDQRRLDRILRKFLPGLPLSALHRLLRTGKITVDGRKAPLDARIRTGQLIEMPDVGAAEREHFTQKNNETRQNRPSNLNILFEGSGLLVLNKPAGKAVHGPDSLEEQVLSYLQPGLPQSLSFKPGPLHRLDKPTSGLIVFSTNLWGARFFSAKMRDRKIRKQYLAIVEGTPRDEVWEDTLIRDRAARKTFAANFDGDPAIHLDEKKEKAITRVRIVAAGKEYTLIRAEIETGRTHQIRAQASSRGHPLGGDKKYGGKAFGPGGFLLHAERLEFLGPGLPEGLPAKFTARLPDNFRKKIRELFGDEITTVL